MLFAFVIIIVCGILLALAGVLSPILGIDTGATDDMNGSFAMLSEGVMAIGCLAGLWVGEAPDQKVSGLGFLRAIRDRL